jgi:2-polyprenyl-3-methyl-5-hydroxy-6-metoxy-1,4-benzoquinol methylase
VKLLADSSSPPWWRPYAWFDKKWREFRIAFWDRHGRSARNVTRRNTRRAYEKLYAADDLLAEYLVPERLTFYDEVASIAVGYAGRSVVDVGCGSGNLLRAVLDRIADSRAVTVERALALDLSRSALTRTADLVPEAEGRVFNLMRDDLDGERFDLVLCTEVLEHLRRPEVARNQLARICARGGTILITVPDGAIDEWEGHVNFWTEDDLRAFLQPLGAATVSRIDADQGLLAIVRPE